MIDKAAAEERTKADLYLAKKGPPMGWSYKVIVKVPHRSVISFIDGI